MYDAVFVLVEALNNVLKKKPDQFRAYTARRNIQQNAAAMAAAANALHSGGHARALDCNMTKGWAGPWEHGDKISRLLRKVIIIVRRRIISCVYNIEYSHGKLKYHGLTVR